jgi:hypothetical protein
MSTFQEATIMRMRNLILVLVATVPLAACLELNKPVRGPIVAAVAVSMGGTVLPPRVPTPMGYTNPVVQVFGFAGEPVAFTLTAVMPRDPDGTVKEYRWMRTDLPRPARYPGSVPPPAPAGAGGAGGAAGGAAGAAGGAAGAAGGAAGAAGGAAGAAGGAAGAAGGAAGAAGAPAPMGPPAPLAPANFAGVRDPGGKGSSVTVTLDMPGSYRFSVWALDNEGFYSIPASVTIDFRPVPVMM